MSNLEPAWNVRQEAEAKAEGWRLVTVIDSGDSHPYLMVASAAPNHTDQAAAIHVMTLARRGSALHTQAMTAVTQSRVMPATPRKKK